MNPHSPLRDAQEKFGAAIPFRGLTTDSCAIESALNRTLFSDVIAPMDSPPYSRAIVEGFLVHTNDTSGATETAPVTFNVRGQCNPGDTTCPPFAKGEAVRIVTGSIVPDGTYSAIRMWDAKISGETFSINRPFAPRFFLEDQGCDLKKGTTILAAGTRLSPANIGTLASLGITHVDVTRLPSITLFASGDEVIPYTDRAKARPGTIFDCNTVMLSAAVLEAGGTATHGGIMRDNFDHFLTALRSALANSDMVIISGGTAIGGRDFVSDLIKEVGTLLVDGVQMRSGRPLIMGVANGKPIVCVAGHPPEALRGFQIFGVLAINKLLGRPLPPPEDPAPPVPGGGGRGGPK